MEFGICCSDVVYWRYIGGIAVPPLLPGKTDRQNLSPRLAIELVDPSSLSLCVCAQPPLLEHRLTSCSTGINYCVSDVTNIRSRCAPSVIFHLWQIMRPTKTHAHELLLRARCIARPTLVFLPDSHRRRRGRHESVEFRRVGDAN